MVVQLHIDTKLTRSLKKEVEQLLPLLDNYTDIQAEPKVLMLRNPSVSTAEYDSWRKDYRYGKFTCPSAQHPCWKRQGAIDEASRLVDSGFLVCVSAMVILYRGIDARVSFHKDPSAYDVIASLTLEGDGTMIVKGGRVLESYALAPGNVVVLNENDCHEAKHSVTSSSYRLGLVLRYATPTPSAY